MANTYTQINLHLVFSVRYRECLITKKLSTDLYKYCAGILRKNKHYALAINGHKDHIHLFFELNPNQSVSDIVRVLKSNSSKWINDNNLLNGKFYWQEGYGAFSYSHSQRNNVIQYVMNQENHHKERSFKDEYMALLKKFEIAFIDNYIFEFFE